MKALLIKGELSLHAGFYVPSSDNELYKLKPASSTLSRHAQRAGEICGLVAQLCPSLCDPIDCSLPGSSVYAILQARILEWVAIPFSWGSSRSRNRIRVSRTAGIFFTDLSSSHPKSVLHPQSPRAKAERREHSPPLTGGAASARWPRTNLTRSVMQEPTTTTAAAASATSSCRCLPGSPDAAIAQSRQCPTWMLPFNLCPTP